MRHATGRRYHRSTVSVAMLVVQALAAQPTGVWGQGTGATAAVVFSRPLTVRSAGLGGAGAALVGDAGAVFSNPAGIATLRHVGVEGSYRSTATDGRYAAAALAWRLRQFSLGLGVAHFGIGEEPNAYTLFGVPVGTKVREAAGVGSLVYRVGILALGGSGKYVQRVVGTSSESAISADVGLAIAIFDIMAIGFSMQNIGGDWSEESEVTMPRRTRVGMTMNYVDPLETFRLLSTLELQWPEGEDFRLVFGAEGGVVVEGIGLFGRAAYGSRSAGSNLSRVTCGASLSLARFALDYAYQASDLNGEPAHRFGMRLTL